MAMKNYNKKKATSSLAKRSEHFSQTFKDKQRLVSQSAQNYLRQQCKLDGISQIPMIKGMECYYLATDKKLMYQNSLRKKLQQAKKGTCVLAESIGQKVFQDYIPKMPGYEKWLATRNHQNLSLFQIIQKKTYQKSGFRLRKRLIDRCHQQYAKKSTFTAANRLQ